MAGKPKKPKSKPAKTPIIRAWRNGNNPVLKRGNMTREQVLDEVSRLDLMGYSAEEIGGRMGVKASQIRNDLRDVRRRYLDRMQRDREADLARKVAQLEQVRSQAWDAWEASKRDRSRRVTEYVAAPPPKEHQPPVKNKPGFRPSPTATTAGFKESMRRLKRVVTVQQGTAESTYLTIITTTLRMEAELLGLFPDMKLRVGVGGVGGGKPALTPDEWLMLSAPIPDEALPPAALPPRVTEAEPADDPVEAEILKMQAQAVPAAPPQRPAGAVNGRHK